MENQELKIELNWQTGEWENISENAWNDWNTWAKGINHAEELKKASVWIRKRPKQEDSNYRNFLYKWMKNAVNYKKQNSNEELF